MGSRVRAPQPPRAAAAGGFPCRGVHPYHNSLLQIYRARDTALYHSSSDLDTATPFAGAKFEKARLGDMEDDEDDSACDGGTDPTYNGHTADGVTPLCSSSPPPPVAAFTTPPGLVDLGGGRCYSSQKTVSPEGALASASGPSEAPPKLKSVVVVLAAIQSPVGSHHYRQERRCTPPPQRDLSPPWEEAKSRHQMQGKSFPSSSTRSNNPPVGEKRRSLPPAYLQAFRSKCFRYLASDHKLAQCRDPQRCLSYRGSGHFARHCPQRTRHPIHSSLTFPPSSIHNRITLSQPDIHSRLTFPPLPTPSPSPVPCSNTMVYTLGAPSQRPSEGYVVLSIEGLMAEELRRLRSTGVILIATNMNYIPALEELMFVLN